MRSHVCPWWGGYFIDNRLRRLLHQPERIVGPYVQPGQTVLDLGCGMGFFSIPLARLVGPAGRVIAADIQPQMLAVLQQRAAKAGVADRIQAHRSSADRLGLATACDFALAFAVLHEAPDAAQLMADVHACLRPAGLFLVAEPRIHVPGPAFRAQLALAAQVGFTVRAEPPVRWCRAAVLAHAGRSGPATRPG